MMIFMATKIQDHINIDFNEKALTLKKKCKHLKSHELNKSKKKKKKVCYKTSSTDKNSIKESSNPNQNRTQIAYLSQAP